MSLPANIVAGDPPPTAGRPLSRIESSLLFELHENKTYLRALRAKIGRGDDQERVFLHLDALSKWLASEPWSLDVGALDEAAMRSLGWDQLPVSAPWNQRMVEWLLLDPDRAARVTYGKREIVKLVVGLHWRSSPGGWSYGEVGDWIGVGAERVERNFNSAIVALGNVELANFYGQHVEEKPASVGWAQQREMAAA